MRKKLKESDLNDKFKSELKRQAGSAGVYDRGTDGIIAINDIVKSIPEEIDFENKVSAKKQFKNDLYDDPDYIKLKKTSGEFGRPNVTNDDPFMKKGKKRNIELEIYEKWSQKYKDSINCNNPKGFSQKAHCQGKKKNTNEVIEESERTINARLRDIARKHVKETNQGSYKDKFEEMIKKLKNQLVKGIKTEMEHKMGKLEATRIALDHLEELPDYYEKLKKIESKEATGSGSAGGFVGPIAFKDSEFVRRSFKETPKKIEATEATGASSAGSYDAPGFEDVKMKGNHERGSGKSFKTPQIRGGKFVEVKKKCKTFPYCNQGDIKALKIWENDTLKKVIKNISKKQNISENVIKNIIAYELGLI